jgi:hypothetical protein
MRLYMLLHDILYYIYYIYIYVFNFVLTYSRLLFCRQVTEKILSGQFLESHLWYAATDVYYLKF